MLLMSKAASDVMDDRINLRILSRLRMDSHMTEGFSSQVSVKAEVQARKPLTQFASGTKIIHI